MDRETILIVDDDRSLVETLSIRLKAEGYEVLGAYSGSEAVQMSKEHEPDLLLLDIRLPEGDGFYVIDELRHSIKTRSMPIIIITAMEKEENRRKAEQLGVFRFFRKPYEPEELLKAIEEALTK